MNLHRYFGLLLGALVLSGCASIHPAVENTAEPVATSGYVSGGFTRNKGNGFAFIVRSLDSDKEYGMSLGEDSAMPSEVSNQVVAIALPPGRYSITQWVAYATLTKEKMKTSPVTNEHLSTPFTVKAGGVVYLGDFSILTTRTYSYPTTYTNWSIRPQPLTTAQARRKFFAAYPKFDLLTVDCHLCLERFTNPAGLPANNTTPQ